LRSHGTINKEARFILYIFRAVVFYTVVLFPTTAKSLAFAKLHVSATYCSHRQGAII
jgi:hypothetical protein